LQAWIRQVTYSIRFRRWLKTRIDAANMIKRNWKEYRRITMLPKVIANYKHGKSTIIQRFMRGWIVCHKRMPVVRKNKININLDYFEGMRTKVVANAIWVIAK
jgi:hypothetical protein